MAERLDLDGPAAPPRRNGELVFEAPWESRLFGLTMALHEAGAFSWDEFRSRLIAEIRHAEGRGRSGILAGVAMRPRIAAARKGFLCARRARRPCPHARRAPPGHDHG